MPGKLITERVENFCSNDGQIISRGLSVCCLDYHITVWLGKVFKIISLHLKHECRTKYYFEYLIHLYLGSTKIVLSISWLLLWFWKDIISFFFRSDSYKCNKMLIFHHCWTSPDRGGVFTYELLVHLNTQIDSISSLRYIKS